MAQRVVNTAGPEVETLYVLLSGERTGAFDELLRRPGIVPKKPVENVGHGGSVRYRPTEVRYRREGRWNARAAARGRLRYAAPTNLSLDPG